MTARCSRCGSESAMQCNGMGCFALEGQDESTPPQAPEEVVQLPLLESWNEAYLAFLGAFDTPQQRRAMPDDYSTDARRRMREFDAALRTALATQSEAVEVLVELVEAWTTPGVERWRKAMDRATALAGKGKV